MANNVIQMLERRIPFPPYVSGQVKGYKPLEGEETVLVTLSKSFEKAGNSKDKEPDAIVALPRRMAEHMSLRQSYFIVCSPVNYRRDPDVLCGIMVLSPLTGDNPELRAA